MSRESNKKKIDYWLPKAFEGQPGKVDVSLLGELFHQLPKSSSRIRTLIKNISNITIKSTDSAIDKLAELVTDPSFSYKWIVQEKSSVPKWNNLVYSLIGKNDPSLSFDRLIKIGFLKSFDKIKKSFAPDLAKIDEFVLQIKISTLEKRYAGLLAWVLIADSRVARAKHPSEKTFIEFENAFCDSLRRHGLEEIILYAYPADWILPVVDQFDARSKKIDVEIKIAGKNNLKKSKQLCFKEKIESDILIIIEKIEKCAAINSSLTSRFQHILDDDEPKILFKSIRDQLINCESIFDEIISEIEIVIREINENIDQTVSLIGVKFVGIEAPKNTINSIKTFLKNLPSKIEEIYNLLSLISSFENEKHIEKIKNENAKLGVAYEYEGLDEIVKKSKYIYDINVKGASAEEIFTYEIGRNQKNLDWIVFADEKLTDEYWDQLGAYYIYNRKISSRLGIIVHHRFDSLHDSFAAFLSSLFPLKDEDLAAEIISSLSWLSLGQREKLANIAPELKTVISLCHIDSYLSALETGMDQFVFWSLNSLVESCYSHNSPQIRNFFKFIRDQAYTSPITNKKIALSIAKVKIERTKSQDKQGSSEAFSSDLKDRLAFRKKGGKTTYSHIWQAAYDEIFSPLLATLNNSGIPAFIEAYTKWNNEFVIENHIDEWKSEIPEHLKKNSEYDKFIRNQVLLKTSELDNCISIYGSLNGNKLYDHAEALVQLNNYIAEIYKLGDHDSLVVKYWLEYKVAAEKLKYNRYFCISQDINSCVNVSAALIDPDVAHPRAFSNKIIKHTSYESIYTDDLIASFDFYDTKTLLEIYAENDIFDAYTMLASDCSDEIPPALDRQVERRFEELELDLKQRLQSLTSLQLNDSGILALLEEATTHIQHQRLREAGKCFSEAEDSSRLLVKSRELILEKEKLISQITKFDGGQNAKLNLSVDQLRETLEKLLAKAFDRRLHIAILERFHNLKSTGFEQELFDCIEKLDQPSEYPSEAESYQLKFYLSQALDPLYEELNRSQTLIPSYVTQLKQLGKILFINIQKDENIFDEKSPLISILIDTSELWQRLSSEGKSAVDKIIDVFSARGVPLSTTESSEQKLVELSKTYSEQKNSPAYNEFEILNARAVSEAINCPASIIKENNFLMPVTFAEWASIAENSLIKYRDSGYKSKEDLANWAVAFCFVENCTYTHFEYASAIRLINRKFNASTIKFLHHEKLGRNQIGGLICRFLIKLTGLIKPSHEAISTYESLQFLVENISQTLAYQESFRCCFDTDKTESIGIRLFWESFSGEQKQAESRALFMYLAWQLYSTNSIAYCLTLSPIDLEMRKAEALAQVAINAIKTGNTELLQGFLDLKKNINAKPFQIFLDLMLKNSNTQSESPAKLTLIGGLERHHNGTLTSVLKIEPRRIDSPDSLILTLPQNCPVRFETGVNTKILKGPFFVDATMPIIFTLIDERAKKFGVEVDCAAESLTGAHSRFSQTLEFFVISDVAFDPLPPDDIDNAFNNFPDAHMRGDDYVPRFSDEQKIEKALFKSKTVRSIWISSPRRSGKTTMLYRILDAYSHKANREDLVVYLTLDEAFNDAPSFNRWIWRRLRSVSSNKELRDLYADFESIGKGLIFDSDAGTFLGELANKLLASCVDGTRIIFLIDEIDRFASMYFEGGEKRSAAIDILWQIRHMISDRRDIGMVFAGSSAAKQIFIARADSPFYNSIDHLELTPFSCKTKAMEDMSRLIVEPSRIRSTYELTKDSLEHLIWICAGIPYYMKLLAGATYAKAQQSHILKSDINEGLRALLSKETGISKLDDMGGDPGSDDLRTTISIERNDESVLAKAVLYSLAEIHSPLSGYRIYRGKITSLESRLVSHYKIPKNKIERGLDICIALGLVKMVETESVPELEFSMPLLGEALRRSSGRYWASIDHELVSLKEDN